MTHEDTARLKIEIAVARALLDEIERAATPDASLVGQLVEELSRVIETLSPHASPSPSGVRLRHVA